MPKDSFALSRAKLIDVNSIVQVTPKFHHIAINMMVGMTAQIVAVQVVNVFPEHFDEDGIRPSKIESAHVDGIADV
jgi:hypothetical protein